MALTKTHNRMIAGAVINVLDYGADSTGLSDSYVAIQAAIDFASMQIEKPALYFPNGVYSVSQTLDFAHPECKVFGDGRHSSVIKFTGSGTALKFTNQNPNNGAFAFGGAIEDICIEGNTNATNLLYVGYVNHFLARNINLREANSLVGVGLRIEGTVLGCFENIYCSTNAQTMTSRPNIGILVDRDLASGARATACTFLHCVIEGTVGDGIQLVNSDQSMFLGGASENNNGNGVTISPGSRMNTFISVAFENQSGTTFADVFDGGFSNRFINCYTGKLFYIDTSSVFSRVEGGFHQSINALGDFATIQDLRYSFFLAGGTINVSASTSTRNLQNAQTGNITFSKKAAVVQTVTASPYTYTNGTGQSATVIVQGGTVTQIVYDRNGPVANLQTNGTFVLAPQDKLIITYSSAPTVTELANGTNYI